MMAGEKIKVDFTINKDSQKFLESMVEKYGLANASKAM